MNTKVVKFATLAPGSAPFGGEPLFRVVDARAVPFKEGAIVNLRTMAEHGITLDGEERGAVSQALQDAHGRSCVG